MVYSAMRVLFCLCVHASQRFDVMCCVAVSDHSNVRSVMLRLCQTTTELILCFILEFKFSMKLSGFGVNLRSSMALSHTSWHAQVSIGYTSVLAGLLNGTCTVAHAPFSGDGGACDTR